MIVHEDANRAYANVRMTQINSRSSAARLKLPICSQYSLLQNIQLHLIVNYEWFIERICKNLKKDNQLKNYILSKYCSIKISENGVSDFKLSRNLL